MREVKKNMEEMSRKKSHYLYMRSVNRVNASAMELWSFAGYWFYRFGLLGYNPSFGLRKSPLGH
jgi:hypothetical protein